MGKPPQASQLQPQPWLGGLWTQAWRALTPSYSLASWAS